MARAQQRWPDAGWELLKELGVAHGQLALVTGDLASTDHLIQQLTKDLDLLLVRLGGALCDCVMPPTQGDLEAAVGQATIVADLELLMWPDLGVRPLELLTRLSRRRPMIAVWPGEVVGDRARYSRPGRPDHHDLSLRDAVVLRPRPTSFPDEVPYNTERIAP